MRRLLPPALVAAVLVASPACFAHYRGNVTLEDERPTQTDVPAASAPGISRYATRPPVCNGELAMPEYPERLLGPEAPVVRVRVDLLLDDEGIPEEVVASLVRDDEDAGTPPAPGEESPVGSGLDDVAAALFLEAAETAVSQWRCRPAWRPPRPDEPPEWVRLPYRTWLLFRFDAERVDRKAAVQGRD